MARSWTEAQERERAFWARIYVERQPDIQTYMPVRPEVAIDFTALTLGRHRLELAALDGKTIADIGCGPYGILYGILHAPRPFAHPPVLIGVDPLIDFYVSDIGMLRPGDQLQLHQAQAENLPIADDSCDFVFCVNALDHMEHPARCVDELHRIMKPGGVCGISLHTVTRPFSPAHRLLKYVDSNHPHHFTLGRVRALLAKRFARVEVTYIASVLEDQPEFALSSVLRSPNKPLAVLRWLSTFVLQTVYFTCEKR
jgi:ubiquinone/menaquinone biosynthesis C-methylase UbiE